MWHFVCQELTTLQEVEMSTLRKTVTEKDEESRKRQSLLDAKLQELDYLKTNIHGEIKIVWRTIDYCNSSDFLTVYNNWIEYVKASL